MRTACAGKGPKSQSFRTMPSWKEEVLWLCGKGARTACSVILQMCV